MWGNLVERTPVCGSQFPIYPRLESSVLGGVRPSVPQGEHSHYVELMRDCWSCDETSRPTFHEIAIRLEEMSDNYCPFGERK